MALSQRLGLARNTVQARLARLEGNGVLAPLDRRVRPEALGYRLGAYVSVQVTQRSLAEVSDALAQHPRGARGDRPVRRRRPAGAGGGARRRRPLADHRAACWPSRASSASTPRWRCGGSSTTGCAPCSSAPPESRRPRPPRLAGLARVSGRGRAGTADADRAPHVRDVHDRAALGHHDHAGSGQPPAAARAAGISVPPLLRIHRPRRLGRADRGIEPPLAEEAPDLLLQPRVDVRHARSLAPTGPLGQPRPRPLVVARSPPVDRMAWRGPPQQAASAPVGWMLRGAAAGAAGTTALNAVTYLDMAVRGRGHQLDARSRPWRSSPDKAHVAIPGDGTTRKNRTQGLGALTRARRRHRVRRARRAGARVGIPVVRSRSASP